MSRNALRHWLGAVPGFVMACSFVAWAPPLMAQAVGAPGGDQTSSAPPVNQAPPSLKDLGISPEQSQGSALDQARLDKRSHMLKIHQRLGLITLAPLVATLVTSNGAAGRSSSASGRELHAALGVTTASLYLTTAYFAIRAPKIPVPRPAGPSSCTKPWPVSTARAWC